MVDANSMLDALIAVASAIAGGAAEAVGGDLWQKVKGLLRLGADASPGDLSREELAHRLEQVIHEDPSVAERLQALLSSAEARTVVAQQPVGIVNLGNIAAERVIQANSVGTINL